MQGFLQSGASSSFNDGFHIVNPLSVSPHEVGLYKSCNDAWELTLQVWGSSVFRLTEANTYLWYNQNTEIIWCSLIEEETKKKTIFLEDHKHTNSKRSSSMYESFYENHLLRHSTLAFFIKLLFKLEVPGPPKQQI